MSLRSPILMAEATPSPIKQGASPEETERTRSESKDTYEITVLLELAEDDVYNKREMISDEVVDDLVDAIEEARSSGADLSGIFELDRRVAMLQREAPRAAIEGALRHARALIGQANVRSEILHEWYDRINGLLSSHSTRMQTEWVERYKRELRQFGVDAGLGASMR